MILDEAQAIKSSSSARWKTLLNFQCRNRLLLTGTPVQNSMQGELNRPNRKVTGLTCSRTLGSSPLHHAKSL